VTDVAGSLDRVRLAEEALRGGAVGQPQGADGFRIVRAQRFRQVDVMFALLIIFGMIGVASDLSLRWLRNRVARWARP
jgi:ABC-type nitrate/sulfonate/bicarbonate transport system permease component